MPAPGKVAFGAAAGLTWALLGLVGLDTASGAESATGVQRCRQFRNAVCSS